MWWWVREPSLPTPLYSTLLLPTPPYSHPASHLSPHCPLPSPLNPSTPSTQPFLSSIASSVAGAYLADLAIERNAIRRKVRTTMVAVGFLVPAVGLCVLRYSPNVTVFLAILTLMMATAGLGPRAGYLPNMLDVAPNYAGVVMGTADAVATVLIIIMHAIVMRTTNDSTDIG